MPPPPPSPSVQPSGPGVPSADRVTEILDPVLIPLRFAPGQAGVTGDTCQVVYCRGDGDSPDGGCVDLIVDLQATPDWHIVDVRYWGFESDRWHLDFDRGARLEDQLAGLSRRLPVDLRADGPQR